MSEEPSTKMIVLRSSDGQTFEVEESTAVLCQTIKHMVEDDCTNTTIPVPNVAGDILARVIEYCKKHSKKSEYGFLGKFDKDFVNVDNGTLVNLVLAATFLDMKSLLDLICETVAERMKGKTVEEIRKDFKIKNDFTPEEEAEVRRENSWAFE